MSRLTIITESRAEQTVESIYKDIERRIVASPPGLCPIDLLASFLKMTHAQSCGKCVPCRVGLGKLENMLDLVLDGNADEQTLELIEETAKAVYYSSDCAIGWESANMVLKGLNGFREDFISHINSGRCTFELNQPVPCRSLCPAGVDVPGYIALVHEGRYADAIRLIRKDNPFPLVCGLICEHPCERRCRRTMIDFPVNIRGLKRYAAEHAGDVPVPENGPATGKKVAIVGGGPSGLSAAYYLALMGHEVEVFELRKQLGGMLRYGIPNYRLPRKMLQDEIDVILSTGVKAHTGVEIGKDISLGELKKQFDAVYIAIGAQVDRKLNIEGIDADGIYSAVEILRDIGDDIYPDFTGKNVSVIGGGNVAMDVARTAIRANADKVSVLYRRRQDDMTALEEEVEAAIAEGCEIYDLFAPAKIEKHDDGSIKSVLIQPQIIGEIKGGRPSPNKADKELVEIPTDILIIAVGQGIESKEFEKYGVSVQEGVIASMATAEVRGLGGFYAGGDCVSGPATVIRAIAAGKVAAANIDAYLGFNHLISSDVVVPEARLVDRTPCGRVNMKEKPVHERIDNYDLAELGMSEEEALQESSRCLRCDHFGYGIFKGGRTVQW
ncbi:MAG: FAD-dependent oxidoreductase [Clostridiales bacterium]|nr:FAD-dependent oxidoreductase [Clostridiales bacterium]